MNLQRTGGHKGARRPPFIGTRESNHWMSSNHSTTALARPGSQCHRGGTHTTTQEKPELPQLLQMNSDSGKVKLDRKLTNKSFLITTGNSVLKSHTLKSLPKQQNQWRNTRGRTRRTPRTPRSRSTRFPSQRGELT